MRPVRRLPLLALLAAQTVAACDCESMLASRRRQGSPTTSEGRAWDEPAASPTRSTPTARLPAPAQPASPVAPVRPSVAAPVVRAEKPLSEEATPMAPIRPGRGGFDRFRPVKLPRKLVPAQQVEGGSVEPQAAEPHELLDR